MDRHSYDFWILDLDGTVVDTDPSYVHEVVRTVGERLGVSFDRDDIVTLWYGMGGSRDDRLVEYGVDPDRFWRTLHEVENPSDRAAATFLYDDAATFIDELDVPVGLVTHCQRYLAEPVLDRLAITDWFDTVLCCTEASGWKPDPGPVERVVTEMGFDYDAIGRSTERARRDGLVGAMAGDNAIDIGAAWNAGLDGIHVERHDPNVRGRCILGDERVTDFSELF